MRARENPFRTERVLSVRYRLQGISWSELLHRCETLHYRAALVGLRGSGKTTLLEDLESKLRERGFIIQALRLDRDHPRFEPEFLRQLIAGLSGREILMFDGAEQMNPFAWRRFKWRTRKAGGLIITTHRGSRLPTLWECRTSAPLLANIIGELLGAQGLAFLPNVNSLFQKHRGNLRDALRECYDLLAHANSRLVMTEERGLQATGIFE
jgi:hypothetical protein